MHGIATKISFHNYHTYFIKPTYLSPSVSQTLHHSEVVEPFVVLKYAEDLCAKINQTLLLAIKQVCYEIT